MNTVSFHSVVLAARGSRIEATNCAPAAGRNDGCSEAVLVVKIQLTSGSVPLAQSSSKACAGSVAGVGLVGSPSPPGVPLPHSVLTLKALCHMAELVGALMNCA